MPSKNKSAPAADPESVLIKGIPSIAAALGLPVPDTYRLAAADKIPGVGKINGRYYGKLAALRAFDPGGVDPEGISKSVTVKVMLRIDVAAILRWAVVALWLLI